MNMLVKSLGALAVAATVAGTVPTPALAEPYWYWHHHHHYRHAPDYPAYGYGYYPGTYYDPGFGLTAGLIGGIFGAIAGTAISHSGGGHVWRCEHHYRSYRPSTDTYTGYDGRQHVCTL